MAKYKRVGSVQKQDRSGRCGLYAQGVLKCNY